MPKCHFRMTRLLETVKTVQHSPNAAESEINMNSVSLRATLHIENSEYLCQIRPMDLNFGIFLVL